MQKVSVGPSTVAGGTVTLAAFAVAIVAFANGARDEETFSALTIGALSLVTTLVGRFGQAIAQAQAQVPRVPPGDDLTVSHGGGFTQTVAKPRPRRKPGA